MNARAAVQAAAAATDTADNIFIKGDKNMAELSPMMRQYLEIKEQNKDSILFFRLGDFYEMFFDDAKTASDELDLVLTGKDCGLKERAPMCGVPFHSCEGYIARLVERGYKVAICEQTEDPAKAKGLVKRDVIRVITPGTVIEDSMLDESRNNYLASVYLENGSIGIAFCDISTGEAHVTDITGEDIIGRAVDELVRFNASELIAQKSFTENPIAAKALKINFEGTVTERDAEEFDGQATMDAVCTGFNVLSPSDLKIAPDSPAQRALGAAVRYIRETGMNSGVHLRSVDYYTQSQFMRLDLGAVRNLEISETMRSKAKKGSLLWVLDKTKTAMGKRLLRSWFEKPLMNVKSINARLDAVEELTFDPILLNETAEYLSGIRDVERLMTKVLYSSANPRDLLNIAATVRRFPLIKQSLINAKSDYLKLIDCDIDPLNDIADLIESAIDPEAPLAMKDGKIIKTGYNETVDRYRDDLNNSTDIMIELELKERERTGIKNLKVRYNKVFGYYIEVTNSFLDRVPENYVRKQTLTNCERFITEEVKNLETRVLTAREKLTGLEYEIFDKIRKTVAKAAERFQRSAQGVARLDAVISFAAAAVENGYHRPEVNTGNEIVIKDGRHPVVEKLSSVPFVSNDTLLDCGENRCAIITGPNMAGKSTYMRQVAIITIMAQVGSFVPAREAKIGIVDAVYTRVGASDDLASGKSTFMVEMSEVASILKNATNKSLLILDEIGRGTSTFDGMSIARAVLEFIADKNKIGAKSLFATHYHELTVMETELEGVKNYNIAVKKHGDDIIFLRRIVRGGADESYGIEVAKLSGIPDEVIIRAREILKSAEEKGGENSFKIAANEIIPEKCSNMEEIGSELKRIDVDTLTPIEALGVLNGLCKKAREQRA